MHERIVPCNRCAVSDDDIFQYSEIWRQAVQAPMQPWNLNNRVHGIEGRVLCAADLFDTYATVIGLTLWRIHASVAIGHCVSRRRSDKDSQPPVLFYLVGYGQIDVLDHT